MSVFARLPVLARVSLARPEISVLTLARVSPILAQSPHPQHHAFPLQEQMSVFGSFSVASHPRYSFPIQELLLDRSSLPVLARVSLARPEIPVLTLARVSPVLAQSPYPQRHAFPLQEQISVFGSFSVASHPRYSFPIQ